MTATVSQLDLYMMAPAFILVATSLILLLSGAFQKGRGGLPYICLLGIFLSFIASVMLWDSRGYAFSKMIAVDNYSLFFHFIFLIATGISVLISIDYLRERGIGSGEYYALLLLTVFGMILMAGGLNLIIIFLGLEILSLSLYILAGFDREEMRSIESSIKYFLLGAFATGFLLYGMALVYGASGSLRLDEIARFVKSSSMSHPLMFFMGTGLLIVGFGFKIASVPFHIWTPDVYEGAPTPVTAFMSIGAKAAGFAAFVRILMFAFGMEVHWVPLLWVLSVLTMTLGNVVAISQTNIKRMLAYSAIAHTGYLLIGMVAKSSLGLHGILFYLLAYTFMNIGAFTVVISLEKNGEESLNLEDYCGLASKKPLLAGAMAVFMFSLSGIPPTAGFMGKFYLFNAAVKEGYIWLTVIGVINSLISVYYYLRIVVFMYMKEPVKEIGQSPLFLNLICALLITSFVTLYLGLFPSFSLSLIQKVVPLL